MNRLYKEEYFCEEPLKELIKITQRQNYQVLTEQRVSNPI